MIGPRLVEPGPAKSESHQREPQQRELHPVPNDGSQDLPTLGADGHAHRHLTGPFGDGDRDAFAALVERHRDQPAQGMS